MNDFQSLLAAGRDYKNYAQDGSVQEINATHLYEQKLNADSLSFSLQQRLASVKGHYSLLVAAEMWCPDCQRNLSAMNLLCQMQPRIDMRIISKARAERALKALMGVERIAIPCVAVLDAQQHLIGQFIEQPQNVINGDEATREAYERGELLSDTINELLHIIMFAER
ncbi:Thioredoxin [Izhakiella capsodis]|uniref:Thioredoxin n=1 Tax=Izhakiella capsodis TaxID=1367852 RepID=A0A1I4V7L4_9GAMM|nr:thioredoxin family protein [Izhakiella capsodis]SFM97177.1 Thioredoxin [Izhakiella capsodis]